MMNNDLNKDKITVAVLDSGINHTLVNLKESILLSKGYGFTEEGITEFKDMQSRHEHATAIALIIKHICNNVRFININILNKNLSGDGRILIHAFKEVLKQNVDIIHLSLGTTKWRYRWALKRIVNQAEKQNVAVVSAFNNSGEKSYPAHFRHVFGVKGISGCAPDNFHYEKNCFLAPLGLEGIEGLEAIQFKDAAGNSLAAAYISGHIANIKLKHTNWNNKKIKNMLSLQAFNKQK